ncbi:MAG: hypothetical protein ACFFAU_15200 [Candidatus Hodarchaeota archaeon]
MKSLPKLFPQFVQQILNKKAIESPKNWKQDLISLYIVRNSDGICLFSHHFQLGLMSQIENQLIGMGFTALSKMMREVVDASSRLITLDLGRKKVLIEERGNKMAILVVKRELPFYRNKLIELVDYFEKIFELQEQISQRTYVCVEDYALANDLVSLIFSDQSVRILEVIPLIFKSIQKNKPGQYNNKKFQSRRKEKEKKKIRPLNLMRK